MHLLIIVALVVAIIVLWPTWRKRDLVWDRRVHRNYDYYPSTLLGVVLVVTILLLLFGVI
jgi:Protein of unknown function (DUF3309)